MMTETTSADSLETASEIDGGENELETQTDVQPGPSDLEKLVDEAEEFKEKYLRRTADLDNLRKRFKQEKKRYRKFANLELLRDLLEVIDNLERALDSLKYDNEGVQQGIEMVYDQLFTLLNKYNVEEIEALNQPFDPQQHEAMMKEEREDLDRQTVLEVFKKGYKLYERVLRPAAVKVGVPVKSNSKNE